jgi:hypothetical protein
MLSLETMGFYHSDEIDYPKFTLVTEGVCHVVKRLAKEL